MAPDLPASLDLVSARTEFYAHPTALPSVQRGSIKLDLHRRDFTINTLALRLDGVHYGELLDPWGGGRDLRDRLIRVLHSISFIDDPTRMLRAVRLEQRLGFAIEARTLELMQQAMPLLDRVSGERLRDELALVLDEACAGAILTRLQALGLLSAIHPALDWDAWLEARFIEARTFQPPEAWRLRETPQPERLHYALWTGTRWTPIRWRPCAIACTSRWRSARSSSTPIGSRMPCRAGRRESPPAMWLPASTKRARRAWSPPGWRWPTCRTAREILTPTW